MILAAGLASGCGSADPAASAARTPAIAPAPLAAQASLAAYVFDCDGGTSFVLARVDSAASADEVVDLVVADRRYRLPRVLAASGVHYEAGGVSVWNKGREATLQLDGRSLHCVENRPRSIREDARARGVELRATGNEPGWTLELFADRMVFVDAYGARSVTTPRPARRDGPASGEQVYVAETESHRLRVGVLPALCTDSMSGDRRPATVEVQLDGKTYRGCGETLAH